MIAGKVEDNSKALDYIDDTVQWAMTGELAKYFENRMAGERDYGLAELKKMADAYGTGCLNTYKGDSWTALCMINVIKKTLAAINPHKMAVKNLYQEKMYFPILDTPKIPQDSILYASDFSFAWKFDPAVQIQVTIALYRYNLGTEKKIEEMKIALESTAGTSEIEISAPADSIAVEVADDVAVAVEVEPPEELPVAKAPKKSKKKKSSRKKKNA